MSDKNRFSDSSAKSYSQALYELASEEKKLNDIEEHVVSIINLISQSEDFNSLIKDPTNKQEDQLNVINIIFEKFNLNNLLKKFLNFLICSFNIFVTYEVFISFSFSSLATVNFAEISPRFFEQIITKSFRIFST